MNTSIAKAAAFMRQRLHSLAKAVIVVALRFVTDRNPAKADGFTRPRFAHLMLVHQMRASSPLRCGHHLSMPGEFSPEVPKSKSAFIPTWTPWRIEDFSVDTRVAFEVRKLTVLKAAHDMVERFQRPRHLQADKVMANTIDHGRNDIRAVSL
jgi:hypothetical protein